MQEYKYEYDLKIRISRLYDGTFDAIDEDRYDVDHDGERYYPISPVGRGITPYDAVIDLMEQYDEEWVLAANK